MPPGGTDKNKSLSNKPRNSANNSPQTQKELRSSSNSRNSGKSTPASNGSSGSNRLFVSDISQLCMHCAKIIEKDDKGMQCNFCDLYIHIDCDGKIPDELYDMNNKYPDNSLVYLCPKCRPIIPPSKDQVISGIVQKIESILDERPIRPKLSDQILDTLSNRIRDMDRMVIDHSREMSELSTDMSELKSEFKVIALSMQEFLKQTPQPNRNHTTTGAVADHPPSRANSLNFRDPNPQQLMSQSPSQQHPDRYIKNNRSAEAQNHSLANQFPTLSQAHYWQNHPGQRPNWYNHAPITQYQPLDHSASAQPPPNHPSGSRPNAPSKERQTKPNPDTTLVVYNLNRNINIDLLVERLELLCKIYSNEIVNASRMPGQPNKNPPITITCTTAQIKWLFIKEINQLRTRESTANEFKSVFAQPYLSEEGLRRDRQLVRELNHLRSKNTGKVYKIYKNEIHEYVRGEYIPLSENDTEAQTRERSDSVSSNLHYMTPRTHSRRSSISSTVDMPHLEGDNDRVEAISSALENQLSENGESERNPEHRSGELVADPAHQLQEPTTPHIQACERSASPTS